MAILDGFPEDLTSCDICIVGSGPAGLALAWQCERLGLKALVLEAGSRSPSLGNKQREGAQNCTHAPLSITTRKAFGGTSWAWSGVCARLSRQDFSARDHVPFSGWPISYDDVALYYGRAAQFLGCETVPEAERESDGIALGAIGLATRPLAELYGSHFSRSQAITICLNSSVVELKLDGEGASVKGVKVVSDGRLFELAARCVVLAAGGLRTTQLLLLLQRRWPSRFGGSEGALGRYYMGHLTGWIATTQSDQSELRARLVPEGESNIEPHRFSIAGSEQNSKRLLNVSFWPSTIALHDPSHTSGPFSLRYLSLLLTNTFRHAIGQDPVLIAPSARDVCHHLLNIASHPRSTLAVVLSALTGSLLYGSARGVLAREARRRPYVLQYMAEQAPDPGNRVTLTSQVDDLGLPRLHVQLAFSEADAQSIVDSHLIFDAQLRRKQAGGLTFASPPRERQRSILVQARDGYHQLGSTRMGRDPKTSVVDHNCMVHGISNLYVASSSVFPTSGGANPTLTIVALSLRLADLLAKLSKESLCRSAHV